MPDLARSRYETWLHDYQTAWESLDPDAAVALFTDDATYQETPFDEPMRGRDAIHAYWTESASAQSDVRFQSQVLAVEAGVCVAHWHCAFSRTGGGSVELDGIFLFDVNDDGRCQTFREWWHIRSGAGPSDGS